MPDGDSDEHGSGKRGEGFAAYLLPGREIAGRVHGLNNAHRGAAGLAAAASMDDGCFSMKKAADPYGARAARCCGFAKRPIDTRPVVRSLVALTYSM